MAAKRRRLAHVALVLCGGCMSIPDGRVVDAPSLDNDTLERVRDLAFPRSVPSAGRTRAFEYRDRGYNFRSLLEVNEFNVKGAHPIPDSAYILSLEYRPLESPYRARLRAGEGADSFIREVSAVLDSDRKRTRIASLATPPTLVSKMLAQRDLFQLYGLLVLAREHAAQRATADVLLARVAKLVEVTLFSPSEYRALAATRPRKLPAKFSSRQRFSLADNYLPLAVLNPDANWLTISNRGTPFRHFVDYRARSFVRIHVRAGALTSEKLQDLHKHLYVRYADMLHQVAVREEVPLGLETVLVRSVGVLLTDGTFRDSTWPEEVIIRAFKYPVATLDLTTSDFAGTMLYQYKLARERLLSDPASLGLVRVGDDDVQFFGFFGDVPDPRNAYSNTTTTMRENCIGCHAELFYGLNTVFSFERDPQSESQTDSNAFWREMGGGAYQLQTPEFTSLRDDLGGFARDPEVSPRN